MGPHGYSSHLVTWRHSRERGELEGLTPKKRGPKAQEPNPLARELAAKDREIARLKAENAKLQIICDVQEKVSLLLGVTLPTIDYAHTTAIRAKLAERFAPATANRMLAALRGTLKSAFKLGLMSADRMTRACSVEPVRGSRVMKGRALVPGRAARALRVLQPEHAGRRPERRPPRLGLRRRSASCRDRRPRPR
jgi:hypothetical protein